MLAYLWVPRETKVYELASVVSDDPSTGQVTVRSVDDGVVSTVAKTLTRLADTSHFGDFDDLCFMNNLHEAPLLYMLKRRLENDKIYTNTGNILISLNPYKRIPGLYDDPLRYLELPEDDDSLGSRYQIVESRGDLPPHVFFVANSALHALIGREEITNQSVIISGESGAGKTEASKLVMKFLIAANDFVCRREVGASLVDVGDRINKVLLDSNTVFEAFGNSKTVRNDNSSRFGKYIKLQYTADNQLLSAYTETFLLEKSRLVAVGRDERNYHVFYQFVRGLSSLDPALAATLNVFGVEQFGILTEGGCTVIESEDRDVDNFQALVQALRTLGCSPEELKCIFELLACVLHLGNVVCREGAEQGQPAVIQSPSLAFESIAQLLRVPASELRTGMLMHRLQAAKRGSVHMKVLTAEEARNNVTGLIKWLYRSLFSWLVRKVNFAHGASTATTNRKVVKFIGILDIFGFEILGVNSFEQLCINFTNERLQQQFNEHVFVLEQQEYAKEGLDWNSVSFRDNQNVIDLISKKPSGLLSILEEHSMLNRKPDDEKLLGSYNQAHDRVSDVYSKARFGNDSFTVKHFAGEVTYLISGFLSKNNNSLQEDLTEVLQQTGNVFLRNAMSGLDDFVNNFDNLEAAKNTLGFVPLDFELTATNAAPVESKRQSTKRMASAVTVSFQFRNQLDLLIATLRATEPHYIKCIKPNGEKKPNVFSPSVVMEQLRYSGALEVVRIRREGYPSRLPFVEFYTECRLLCQGRGWKSPEICSDEEAKEYCAILAREQLEHRSKYQLGKTFVFLGDGALFLIHESIALLRAGKATFIQKFVRSFVRRRRFQKMCAGILVIQRYIRTFLKRSKAYKIVHERWAREVALALAKAEAEERARKEEEARLEALRLEKEAAELKVRLDKEEKERQMAEAERARLEREAIAQAEAAHLRAERERTGYYKRMSKIIFRVVRMVQILVRTRSIHRACESGNVLMVRKLVSQHPDDVHLLDRSRNFRSVYESAIRGGNVEVLKALGGTARDAVSFRDKFGNSIFAIAAQAPSLAMFQFLGAVVDSSVNTGRVNSAWNTDAEAVALAEALSEKLSATSKSEDLQLSPRVGNFVLAAWLCKRKEKKEWKRRWCELNATEIRYFSSPSDALPKGIIALAHCSIQRVHSAEPIFEVFCPETVKKKFFGSSVRHSMFFLAENEQVVQDWMLYLRAITGSIPIIRELNASRCVSYNARKTVCTRTNANGETALHQLVRSSPNLGDCSDHKLIAVASAAHWFLEFGCSSADANSDDQTAIQLAASLLNPKLAQLLSRLQSSRSLTNESRLRAPMKLPGYTYLSIAIEHQTFSNKLSLDTLQGCDNLRLCISVTNAQNELVEPLQVISNPALESETFAFWGYTWHMQTPLENNENEVVIMFSLWQGSDSFASNTPRGLLTQDRRLLRSGPITIPILKGRSAGLSDTVLYAELILTKFEIEL